MSLTNDYTTRQAASIGLQPGNLIGETHYVTESQITPPIKQRIRSKKLLSTNISRCQCCCPPFGSALCRSCLCPCWAYILIGLLLTLLVAALATELALLAREKIIYRSKNCQYNVVITINNTYNSLGFSNTTITNSTNRPPCPLDGSIVSIATSTWSFFPFILLFGNLLIHWINCK